MSKRKSGPQLRLIMGGSAKIDVAQDARGTARAKAPFDSLLPENVFSPEDGDAPVPLTRAREAACAPSATSPDQEEFCPRYYPGQHEQRRVAADVDRLRYAIVDLASIELEPAHLLAALSPTFDRPVIRDRLIQAIDCLTQFAEQWRLEELTEAVSCARRPGEER